MASPVPPPRTQPPTAPAAPAARSLYTPAPQLPGLPTWQVDNVWVDPATAEKWLTESGQDDEFRNRRLNRADVDRTAHIMRRGGFVNFLPNGPICFDETGVLLNGQTRLTAIVESGHTAGFIIFRGVPRWMFPYMDTGRLKTPRDVLYANYKVDKAAVIAAMKKVIRYEEVLAGIRPPIGWRYWSKEHDQPADLEHVYQLRESMADYYGNALAVRGGGRGKRAGCKLVPTALMLFQFYQWHAWPKGRDLLDQFLESLRDGSNLSSGSPALSLRNFGRDEYCPAEARVEIQLILLFRHFAAYARNERLPRVVWAYGQPMPAPFHPSGDAAAKKALAAALPPLNTPTDTPAGTTAGAAGN